MRFLCNKFEKAKVYYASNDLRKQAKIDEYLDWHQTKLGKSGTKLFRLRLGIDKPISSNEWQEMMDLQHQSLTTLEQYFLQDGQFINDMD